MAEYLTNTTDLTKVASAIREKGGTSDPLVYPEGFVAAIESIEAGGGGAGELFHTEITPATSGEVLTLEVGEKGERIAAMIVSVKVGSAFENNKNYGIMHIGAINTREISKNPSVINIITYREGYSMMLSDKTSAQHNNSTPSGKEAYDAYNFWNSKYIKPWVKFYITNGAESKYGLLVGKTYDIWVIKAG